MRSACIDETSDPESGDISLKWTLSSIVIQLIAIVEQIQIG